MLRQSTITDTLRAKSPARSLSHFKRLLTPGAPTHRPPSTDNGGNIICLDEKPAGSVYSVPLGIDIEGHAVSLKLYEKHTLICGQSGSGKSYLANRILAEIVKLPIEERIIIGIDLKQAEIGKWNGGGCLDAAAINFDYAALLLENVHHEMDRRNNLIWTHPEKYPESKIKPSREFPLIVVYIDELAVLGLPTDDKEEEAIRKTAYSHFRKLLFLARSAGIIVISCIQRPDTKIIDGFTKQNFQQVIGGRVGSAIDAQVLFDDPREYPAHKLSNHWFLAKIEGGNGPVKFKPVGAAKDADLWQVIRDPNTTVPRERASWLYDKSHGKNTADLHVHDTTDTTPPPPSAPSSDDTPKKKRGRPKKTASDPIDTDTSFTTRTTATPPAPDL